MLTDVVNYTSNLIARVYERSERKLRDVIVCYVLLKQFASMLDAVEMLARVGASTDIRSGPRRLRSVAIH